MTPPSPDKGLREAVALTYEEAEKLALQAIHGADGRGMIGRGRNHLHQRVARAILQAHRAALPALSVPEGWVAVPREPTEEMIEAGGRRMCDGPQDGDGPVIYPAQVYRAMLSAIPSPGGGGNV